MKNLIVTLALLLSASSAFAGEDSSDRYWDYGPAWYEIPCGLACFKEWKSLGLEPADVSAAELRRLQTPAELRLLARRAR